MRRTTLVLAAAAAVALTTGCANSPQRVGGEAGPAGAPSPVSLASPSATPSAPSASPPTSPPPTKTSTKPTPKKSSEPRIKRIVGPANVLGPTGLGKLQIGMSIKEAEATGMVEAGEGDKGCGSWYLKPDVKGDATVGWTSRGVVSIPAYDEIATPKGIRIGSNLSEVERAYSDLTGPAADKKGGSWGDGSALAGQKDSYDGVHYQFTFLNGAVVKMDLEHDRGAC